MNTNTTTLESRVTELRMDAANAYNMHRDAVDKLYDAERSLSMARRHNVMEA